MLKVVYIYPCLQVDRQNSLVIQLQFFTDSTLFFAKWSLLMASTIFSVIVLRDVVRQKYKSQKHLADSLIMINCLQRKVRTVWNISLQFIIFPQRSEFKLPISLSYRSHPPRTEYKVRQGTCLQISTFIYGA